MGGVEISGLNELMERFDSLPMKVEKKLLKESLQKLAESYAAALSAAAPYNPSDHPGYYVGHREAFKTKRGKEVKERFARFQMLPHLKYSIMPADMNARNGLIRKRIMANFYARFLEDGTKFMNPEPFVAETIEGAGEALLEEFLGELVEKILEEF